MSSKFDDFIFSFLLRSWRPIRNTKRTSQVDHQEAVCPINYCHVMSWICSFQLKWISWLKGIRFFWSDSQSLLLIFLFVEVIKAFQSSTTGPKPLSLREVVTIQNIWRERTSYFSRQLLVKQDCDNRLIQFIHLEFTIEFPEFFG